MIIQKDIYAIICIMDQLFLIVDAFLIYLEVDKEGQRGCLLCCARCMEYLSSLPNLGGRMVADHLHM